MRTFRSAKPGTDTTLHVYAAARVHVRLAQPGCARSVEFDPPSALLFASHLEEATHSVGGFSMDCDTVKDRDKIEGYSTDDTIVLWITYDTAGPEFVITHADLPALIHDLMEARSAVIMASTEDAA